MKRGLFAALIVLVIAACPAMSAEKKPKAPQQREVKVQKTSLTKDQETQLGKEAAAEVEARLQSRSVLKN